MVSFRVEFENAAVSIVWAADEDAARRTSDGARLRSVRLATDWEVFWTRAPRDGEAALPAEDNGHASAAVSGYVARERRKTEGVAPSFR